MKMIEKLDKLIMDELEAMENSGMDYKTYDKARESVAELIRLRNELVEAQRKVDETDARIKSDRIKIDREFEARIREVEAKEDKGVNWGRVGEQVISQGGVAALMLMILKYEKLDVITSKAFTFIPRLLKL